MFHTRAIILSTKPYREHDELISFFTERFGKRVILARGTRKQTSKLAASLHGLNVGQCSFVEGKRYPVLTSVDQLYGSGSPKNFYGHYLLYAFLALCDSILYEGDRDEKLWNLLSDVLRTALTTERKEKKEWVCIYDEWLCALLGSLGIKDASKIRPEKRPLLRKAFEDAYYKNPYPLEPFAFNPRD